MADIPDHPIIRNCERTGYPDGKEPPAPRCPICGEECETIYRDRSGECVGCDICMEALDAWGVPECFQEKEGNLFGS